MNLGEESVWEDEGYSPPSRRDSCLPSMDFWDYTIELECLKGSQDLHLAAELGKNLLERNKELENDLKQKQHTIDEQCKEIEHLTKQTAALRSTNDNRIRLSEQLEVSIQDLESANKRLTVDCATLRKEMKSLSTYKNALEARCEELQYALEKAQEQQRIQKTQQRFTTPESKKGEITSLTKQYDADDELFARCEELKKLRARDQRVIADLEADLARRAEVVALLEEEIVCLQQKEEQSTLLKEELEEARLNTICSRCCKDMYRKEPIPILEEELYDNLDSEIKSDYPYRNLVEKYDTIMEERLRRRHSRDMTMSMTKTESISNHLSLQEELKNSGDFNSFHKETESEQGKESRRGKATPTDFSEAETLSSGFSDETSSKATQTDILPGSFLCSIEDGPDCRFSIYDTLCPIENHFRKTPVYRSLFREIFDVLKRAAESKDEGDLLPFLDDQKESPKVPPVTPATENLPVDFEDLISLPDSTAASDVSSLVEPDVEEPVASASGTKDILEYVTNARQGKKKKRPSRTPTRRRKELELVDLAGSLEPSPISSPSRAHRRRARKNNASPAGSHVMTTVQRPPSHLLDSMALKEFKSTAAQEVAKLKKLEKSYAEVLAYSPAASRSVFAKKPSPHYGKK